MSHIIKRFAIILFIVIVTALLAYRTGKVIGEQGVSTSFSLSGDRIEETVSKDSVQDIPACDFNGCPEYKAVDTDGDGQLESVVYKRTAMTKGAASVWIIDDDRVVFRSGSAANLSYKQNDDIPGITVTYVKEYDEAGLKPKTWASDKFIFINGEYVLVDDTEGFCEEHLDLESDDETIISFEGDPVYPDYTHEDAGKFRTVIDKTIELGANFAGHYTIATWGCGTDCFGYAVVDLLTGDVVTFSPANGDYNISGLEVKGRYMILNPVSAGQEREYYKLSEHRNYSDEIVSVFTMACSEKSSRDMYGSPE